MSISSQRPVIGVMGPGMDCSEEFKNLAFELGTLIAANGWFTLSGGRNCGVMDAVSKGAKSKNGVTIGILPGENRAGASKHLDIQIITGLGSARNNINVLSSDLIVACGIGPGTSSEISLALKAQKPVILLKVDQLSVQYFKNLNDTLISTANTPAEAAERITELL